ncbi:hypothetical protein HMPREF0178_00884, partial [Bilophila sp. 4_1_30]
GEYDYVLIDCHLLLGFDRQRLNAANGLLVPVQVEYYALRDSRSSGRRQNLSVISIPIWKSSDSS